MRSRRTWFPRLPLKRPGLSLLLFLAVIPVAAIVLPVLGAPASGSQSEPRDPGAAVQHEPAPPADDAEPPVAQQPGSSSQADAAPGDQPPSVQPATPLPATQAAPPPAPPTARTTAAQRYGLWALAPALVAILLSIFTRQVVPSLVIGVMVGAYMMLPCLPAADPFAGTNSLIAGFRLAVERYVMGAVISPSDNFGHLQIMIFTLVIGFLVGVLGRNGGTAGMVRLVAGDTASPRRGTLTAWFAGLIVFFDDYANTMIIGPTMRSVFDRLKVSRAKLAYIVDSTAAPVASIALIGTWVGMEISYINDGLGQLGAAAPAFLQTASGETRSGMSVFLRSIPFRFYPILALVLVFLVCLTGRDFGPMRRAQQQAAAGTQELPYDATPPHTPAPPCWWLGLFPVLTLVVVTVGILFISGYRAADPAALDAALPWWQRLSEIVSGGEAYRSILYGAVLSAMLAVVLTLAARTCAVRDAVDAGLEGMARTFSAVVILVLAWAISGVLGDLMLGEVVAARLEAMQFPVQWMSLAVFLAAALISFATGTSWGTMGILCPLTVTVTVRLLQEAQLEPGAAAIQFYGAVGSVLAGAVFGDHCSPISDTTVLSSMASGCRHEEHVWTQLPYAVVAMIAAMGLGDVMCSAYHQPWYLGVAAGVVFLLLVMLIFGRRQPDAPPPPRPSPPSPDLRPSPLTATAQRQGYSSALASPPPRSDA